jgi:hypothetical protein
MGRPRLSAPGVVRPISVGIPPDMLERLDAAARSERVPRSVLMRELIGDGLDRLDAGGLTPVVALVEPAPVVAPVVDLAERRHGPAIH